MLSNVSSNVVLRVSMNSNTPTTAQVNVTIANRQLCVVVGMHATSRSETVWVSRNSFDGTTFLVVVIDGFANPTPEQNLEILPHAYVSYTNTTHGHIVADVSRVV